MHVLLHSVPPALQQATTDLHLHWRPLDTPRQVWVSLLWGTAPFSWVLVHTRFCLCPPRVCFPVLCKFWQLYGGLMATSSKKAHAIPISAASRAPAPAAGHCWPYLVRRHSNTVLAQSLWGLWVLVCIGLLEPSKCLWQEWGLISVKLCFSLTTFLSF